LVGVALWAEIRRTSRAHGPQPAGPQPLGKVGRFACQPVRRRPARRPRTSGRASRHGPPHQPVPRRIRPTSAGFASECPPSSDEDGRAREAGGGGFGAGAAHIQHRPLGGRLCRRRPEPPGGRRSVIGVEHFPARGRGGDVALSPSPPSSFGRQHRRRVGRRASPLPPGLVVSPQPELVAQPQAVADRPAQSPGRSRTSPGRSSEPRSPSCHQVWEPLPRNGDRLGHSIGL
jgi:hypothetical protein